MVLIVNGERRETEARRIAALLAELEFTGQQLAIAVNRGVVPRKRWSEVELCEGDAIEIISPTAGPDQVELGQCLSYTIRLSRHASCSARRCIPRPKSCRTRSAPPAPIS